MIHFASPAFWGFYKALPSAIQYVADKNFSILKSNPKHPSLHFKKVGRYWSVRVGIHYRALAVEVGVVCFGFGLAAILNMIALLDPSQSNSVGLVSPDQKTEKDKP